ncbi:(R)-stereoselective amidase [Porphyromonas crevioricanis]|uniref:(R)-stereoselective amidase n=1 Tax=Porphyromonas crevioricanis TaxID=393921 RepID=A0A2X4PKE6_9PORP|nr:nitrilase-related carbon-nitrogen hydrolase [Porphyromonas crevioricanis]GAD06630.1 possible hydrolase [Porphyromonas crevioricanis JCM 13913]SQH73210.1 (R)-stereoselective amidase [Porphyromonas crevioricanis]
MKTNESQLHLAVAQYPVDERSPESNLLVVEDLLRHTEADLLVLPECSLSGFSTDFSSVERAAAFPAIDRLAELSARYGVALAGSAFVRQGERYANRGFLLSPDGRVCYQDKRHLFSMAGETELLNPASERNIFEFLGWRILLTVCYDIRFPVWCRNVNNEYDLLINVANWPEPRISAYKILLQARALENLSYVVGANRVGRDERGINYTGESSVVDFKGKHLVQLPLNEANLSFVYLSKEALVTFRQKFPAWKDRDLFSLEI